MNIWILFRLARGLEPKQITINHLGKTKKKTVHYCISCESQRIVPIWNTAYTNNARDHIQKKHRAEWREWHRGYHITQLSIVDLKQPLIDRYTQPVSDYKPSHLVLRQAFDKPRFIRAFIALCARRRVSLNATDWPELQELVLAGNPIIQDLLKLSRRTLVRLLEKNHLEYRKELQIAI